MQAIPISTDSPHYSRFSFFIKGIRTSDNSLSHSLRKQPTFGDASTSGGVAKCRLSSQVTQVTIPDFLKLGLPSLPDNARRTCGNLMPITKLMAI